MRILLASASPRRAELLQDAGIAFEALPVQVDEARCATEAPLALVRRLAEAKARTGAARVSGPALIIGADTEVVLDGEVLGKPASDDDARRMLRRLNGRTHEVITGVAVLRLPDHLRCVEHEVTRVTFAPLRDADIDAYVASEEHRDKAGGYAIQGRGGIFITGVEGCYFNVVGLPLARLARMLRAMGWKQD
jgi:septum formation protein